MAVNWKRFLQKAGKPALGAAGVVLLILLIKQCSDGDKSRETNEIIKKVAENVDSIKQERRLDADTVKYFAKSTDKIVRRTENKVNEIRAVQDSILAKEDAILDKIDSCCDCDKKEPVKTRTRKVPRSGVTPVTHVNTDTVNTVSSQSGVSGNGSDAGDTNTVPSVQSAQETKKESISTRCTIICYSYVKMR